MGEGGGRAELGRGGEKKSQGGVGLVVAFTPMSGSDAQDGAAPASTSKIAGKYLSSPIVWGLGFPQAKRRLRIASLVLLLL